MKLRLITAIVLTACSCLFFTACYKEGSGITPSEPLHLTINEKSYSEAKPLVLIDGVEIDDIKKVKINPSDIKSMTVLKSSPTNNLVDTFGIKAKDGVILVSTKGNE